MDYGSWLIKSKNQEEIKGKMRLITVEKKKISAWTSELLGSDHSYYTEKRVEDVNKKSY